MFILVLKYISPLNEIDNALEAHVEYLNKYYALGKFICSGRQTPRIGGIILCIAKDKNEVKDIIKDDPFYNKQLAKYETIEFTPSKCADDLKFLLN